MKLKKTYRKKVIVASILVLFLILFGIVSVIFFQNYHITLVSRNSPNTTARLPEVIKTKTPLDVSDVIQLNKKFLVYVICLENDGYVAGSGTIIGRKGDNLFVLTNYHIVENAKKNRNGLPSCTISHLEKGEYYYVEQAILNSFTKKDMEIVDFAVLKVLPEPKIEYKRVSDDGSKTELSLPTTLLSSNTFPTICSPGQASIGDKVVILGFPGIGGTYIPNVGQIASFTATEGIISTEVTNDKWYIKTSAKIDAGNSGGGAFLVKDGCLIGMPSYTNIGGAESLGGMVNLPKLFDEFLTIAID